ncbi:MAG: MFS transporter [Proteobacteria bacterium]|nr:MFS transporter [Pseudomonadota bacterium]
MSEIKTLERADRLPLRHVLGFSIGLFGVNTSFGMVSSFLPYFYTDVFLLSPAIMGVLFASCRIWDGINDPVMGMVVDSTNSRWGRFRPYLLMTPIPMIVFFALTFYAPDLGVTGKIVWAFVTYFGLQMVKTSMAVPYHALPAVMTSLSRERTKISGFQHVCGSFTFLLIGAGTLPLVGSFATEKEGFFNTALIYGVIATIAIWIAFVSTRKYDSPERYHQRTTKNGGYTVKDKLSIFVGNTPLMKLVPPLVFNNIVTAIVLAMGVYFFKYNLKMMDRFPAFMGMFVVALMLGSAAAPAINNRLGKMKTFHITNLLSMMALLSTFVIAWQSSHEALRASWQPGGLSFALILAALFFSSFQGVLFPVMVLDCIEYGEWKSGVRMEGLINSAFLIANKGGMALGGFVVGIGLWLIDYVPNQEVYSEKVLMGIAVIFLLVPSITRILMSLSMTLYDLNEAKHQEIVQELARR